MPRMRSLLVSLVLLLGVLFVINHFTQLESVVTIAQKGDWRYFGAALIIQIIWLVATAATYLAVFRAIGVNRKLRALIPVAAAANFVNVVAPSGGMSGMAVLFADARRNRFPPAYATVSGALFVLAEYIGFTFFLILGLVVLARRGDLNSAEIFASAFLWLSALMLALTLYLGMRSERVLARYLRWVVRLLNRVVHPFRKEQSLSEERADLFAHNIAAGLVQVRQHPEKLLPALLASFISKAMMLAVFGLMFLAFRVPLSAGTLFAGFALAYLFMIVSPTPAGIGVVEGLVTLSLVSMFVPVGAAAVVVLAYRAITFWLPLFLGMLAVQGLSFSTSSLKE